MAITLRFGAPIWGALLFVLVLGLLAGIVAVLFVGTHHTAFTIRGQTDVITVQPGCGQSLTWDLPAGRVRTIDDVIGGGDRGPDRPVSLVLREGSQALLEIRDGQELRVLVTRVDGPPRCRDGSAAAVAAASSAASAPLPVSVLKLGDPGAADDTAADVNLPPTSEGYAYRSTTGVLPRVALRLAGRVLLGSPVVDGGGWTGSQRGMLHAATIEGRVRHWPGDQQAVLLRDEVDPGSMVDTHACLGRGDSHDTVARCEAIDGNPAVGFATVAKRDDGHLLDIVVHRQAEAIGVLPYAGEQRRARVTWWTGLIHLPLAQQTVALLVLLTTLLGHHAALKPLLTCLLPRRWRIGAAEAAPPTKPDSPPPDGGSP